MKANLKFMIGTALVAACYTAALYAADAGSQPATEVPAVASWLQYLIGIILSAVGTFALPYLHNLAAQARIEATTSSLSQREALLKQLKAFLLEQADELAVDRWPILAQKVSSGELKDSAAIKAELYAWGDDLKKNAIAYFKAGGIDIVATLGEAAIDELITLAANHTSPFPGKEAATEVLKHNIVPLLIQNGVRWLRDHYFKEGATPIVNVVTLPQQPGERAARIYYKVVAA